MIKTEMDWIELTRIRDDLRRHKNLSNDELVAALQFSIYRIHTLEDILNDIRTVLSRT